MRGLGLVRDQVEQPHPGPLEHPVEDPPQGEGVEAVDGRHVGGERLERLAGRRNVMAALADLVLEPGGVHQQLLEGEPPDGSRRSARQRRIEAEPALLQREQGQQALAPAQPLPPGLDRLSLVQVDRPRAALPLHPQDAALAYLAEVLEQGPEGMVGEVPLEHLEGGGAVGEQSVEPEEQLLEITGAGQVVVRPGPQGRHPLGGFVPAGQHEDRHGPRRRLSPQGLQDRQPGVGRLPEHHQIGVLLLGHGGGPGPVAQPPHLMAGHVEPVREHGGEHGIAVDHQDFGQGTLSLKAGGRGALYAG